MTAKPGKARGLSLRALSVALRGRALFALTFDVAPGEVVTVMGPSGSGKSTLLAAIGGFLDPDFSLTGAVRLDGRDLLALAPEARATGILFQDDLLFPHLCVADNAAFALPPEITGRRARRRAAEEALVDVGLDGLGPRDPATLSGGQRARVALVRVLLSEPRALLLDEPFSRLDTALRAKVRALVFERARARGLPVLLVTHDAEDARAAGGPLIRL